MKHTSDFHPAILSPSGRAYGSGFPARLASAQERGSVRPLTLEPYRTASPGPVYRVAIEPLSEPEERQLQQIDRLRRARLDIVVARAALAIGTIATAITLLRVALALIRTGVR